MTRAPRSRRRPTLALLGAPLAAVALLVAQARHARRRSYLPRDPGYRIDGWVEPGGGTDGQAPVRLVLMGDSTVAGVGAPSAEESLPVLVAERVARALARPVEVHGFGVAGARTRDLGATQLPDAAALDPDVVVAVVGSNDVTHLTGPGRLRRDLDALVGATRSATRAPLVLAGVPRFHRIAPLGEPLSTAADAYAAVLRAVQRRVAARRGVPFVEIARDASPRFRGVPEAMSADGFHPAPVGYGFWADAIAAGVTAALARADRPTS